MTTKKTETSVVDQKLDRRRPTSASIARDMLRLRRTQVGLVLAGVVVLVAIFGPLMSAHSPTELVGAPYAPPSGDLLLGGDNLGRDVLSRFLNGGRDLLGIAILATVLGVMIGALIGMGAGYARGRIDEILMRLLDVVLSFPTVILPLLMISILGYKWWLVVVTIAVLHVPYVARVVRAATQQVIEQDYIKYAEAVGVKRRKIIVGEILPNITAPLSVEFGIRITYSIALVAALAYLGFGAEPPAADWGTLITENQAGVTLNIWPVALPVIAIALLAIGLNLVTDGFGQAAAGVDRKVDVLNLESEAIIVPRSEG